MSAPPFLQELLGYYTTQDHPPERPFVTLTFAQSLDGKIAGKGGKQLLLSGKESMIMTHWMRTLHDGILIGIGTALNDDPQLNTRHLPPKQENSSENSPNANSYHLPRPIILDSRLRLPPSCKLLRNYQSGIGRRPFIVAFDLPLFHPDYEFWKSRKDSLEMAGARLLLLPWQEGARFLPLSPLLKQLLSLGIKSIMVEGGAKVIQSFLGTRISPNSRGHNDDNDWDKDTPPIVDNLVLTVSPNVVGDDGVGYGFVLEKGQTLPGFRFIENKKFGIDEVLSWRSASGICLT